MQTNQTKTFPNLQPILKRNSWHWFHEASWKFLKSNKRTLLKVFSSEKLSIEKDEVTGWTRLHFSTQRRFFSTLGVYKLRKGQLRRDAKWEIDKSPNNKWTLFRGQSRPLILYFHLFWIAIDRNAHIFLKLCRCWDSNQGSLMFEATTLPTAPQPRPTNWLFGFA